MSGHLRASINLDFAALNRAAAAEMALRQREAGRRDDHRQWLRDSFPGVDFPARQAEVAERDRARPGGPMWSYADGDASYPGLNRRRTPWRERMMPELPAFFRAANRSVACGSIALAAQAPFVLHYSPDSIGSQSMIVMGVVLTCSALAGWIAERRHAT